VCNSRVRHNFDGETEGVNFTNVLRAAFMLLGPESVKNTVKLQFLFTLSGSLRVKAVHRTLMNLSPCAEKAGEMDKKNHKTSARKIKRWQSCTTS